MKKVIDPSYARSESMLDNFIANFDTSGNQFGVAARNTIKLFDLNGQKINIKAFKVPILINQIIYKFFRKSKAQRSFDYAIQLKSLDVKTPNQVAYYEFSTLGLFKKCFYVSEHLDCDLTFRELTKDLNYPEHEIIVRAFTRFTYHLHEKGVHFLDHSPGNTLIIKTKSSYDFYLVDLNRMEFKEMDFETRIDNFSKLTVDESIVRVMSDEYAKCSGHSFDVIFDKMWRKTCDFQFKFHRKKRLKKRFLFWK
ncbi:Kdo domain containing protein [Flavobacteriaceae bacterium]|jgi:hypothetical protein|nr:Kdo domain containing protein [Flavobacteriaceae bacterium]